MLSSVVDAGVRRWQLAITTVRLPASQLWPLTVCISGPAGLLASAAAEALCWEVSPSPSPALTFTCLGLWRTWRGRGWGRGVSLGDVHA